jgi:hypothetical protein
MNERLPSCCCLVLPELMSPCSLLHHRLLACCSIDFSVLRTGWRQVTQGRAEREAARLARELAVATAAGRS